MEKATEKQVVTLKKLARNPELSQGLLKGVRFDELSKQEASQLISKCFNNDTKKDEEENGDYNVSYSQNYRDNYGIFRTTTLTDDELEAVRDAHRKHCQEILEECNEDYPEESELVLAVFGMRCDKIFTWIQQALDEKVRKQRPNNQN
jgi:hypothetical protein